MAIEDCSKEENVPGYAHKHITFHFRNNPVIKGSEIADEMKKKKKRLRRLGQVLQKMILQFLRDSC